MTLVPGGKEPDIVRVLVSRVSLIVARPRHIHLADDTVGPMTMVYLQVCILLVVRHKGVVGVLLLHPAAALLILLAQQMQHFPSSTL